MPDTETTTEKTETTAPQDKSTEKAGADEKIQIKVNGEDRLVTREELVELAQKSAGADAKFRDAAALREEGKRGVRIGELFDKLSKSDSPPSKTDVTELSGLIGLDPSELQAWLDEDEETPPNKDKKSLAGQKKDKKLAVDDLPDEVKAVLERDKKGQYAEAVKIIQDDCKKAIDKDKILAKMMENDEGGANVATLSKMVFNDVQRRIFAGEQYGPEMVASSIQTIRADLQQFGIPSGASKHPANPLPVGLGFGLPSELPAEVYADETIERTDSSDPIKYADNFLKRWQQGVVKAMRSGKKS